MNPARSFGPALWNGNWDRHWVMKIWKNNLSLVVYNSILIFKMVVLKDELWLHLTLFVSGLLGGADSRVGSDGDDVSLLAEERAGAGRARRDPVERQAQQSSDRFQRYKPLIEHFNLLQNNLIKYEPVSFSVKFRHWNWLFWKFSYVICKFVD